MKTPWLFERVTSNRPIDGDSFMLNVDTGFYNTAEVHVRLVGVDTPERGKDPEGWRQARAFVENWMAEAKTLQFRCVGPDKYGRRWLGTVHNKAGESLTDALIASKMGVPYDGGSRT